MISLEQKPSILVVEDERIIAKDLQQTLNGMGYDAFAIASSADEAFAAVSERCPDIVLMDIRIKGPRDGIQTAEILKTRFDLPIIYLSAHADETTIARARLTEPHGYLLKPVKSAELRTSIEVSLFKHRMERRLRERARWFSTTLRSITDAVVTVDISSKVTFLNPAAETLIGLPSAEVVGKPASAILRLMNEQSQEFNETPLDMALHLTKPVVIEEATLLNLATGAHHLIEDSAAPVIDGKLTLGAVMVFRDITEKKKLQKRLEFADRLTSLGTMADGTAQELNVPLAAVLGRVSFAFEELALLRADLDAGVPPHAAERRLNQIAGSLEDVRVAAGRMQGIIADLQTFARPSQTPGLVDLSRCVQWGVRSTYGEFRSRARLITQFGDVPLVRADEARLAQVVINLLLNAAQAIPPGNSARNEVRVTTYTDDRGRAAIEVQDTGAGIEPNVLPRIFDPFFTTKDQATGGGLGLSICHGIVKALHGEITVDSQAGKGSKFRVLLPLANETAGPPEY
jgi:two-component system cell cycle sensor histidine kinase/response regulator CckA